jgi:hypothetical protein
MRFAHRASPFFTAVTQRRESRPSASDVPFRGRSYSPACSQVRSCSFFRGASSCTHGNATSGFKRIATAQTWFMPPSTASSIPVM